MSASHRICETCVYCSFAGNCDRYDKPLTSIEQPACDAYEIHPLLAENVKLRELADAVKEFVEDTHCEDCPCRRDCDDNNCIFCVNDLSYHAFAAMRELGAELDG